jgi:hypothetical protein
MVEKIFDEPEHCWHNNAPSIGAIRHHESSLPAFGFKSMRFLRFVVVSLAKGMLLHLLNFFLINAVFERGVDRETLRELMAVRDAFPISRWS